MLTPSDEYVAAVNRTASSKFPLVCFDLDGTLVDETIYIWQTLHEHFQTDSTRRNQARQAFFDGQIPYEEWFSSDLVLLGEAGADRASMVALFETLPVMPGALEVLATLRERGSKIAIISGSVDLVLETLFPDQSFDAQLINRLRFDSEGRLVGGVATPYDMDRKADGLRELALREGLEPEAVAFVGDNDNDLAVARAAGFAIAFNCKSPELAEVADVVIQEHDLRAVLPYLTDEGL